MSLLWTWFHFAIDSGIEIKETLHMCFLFWNKGVPKLSMKSGMYTVIQFHTVYLWRCLFVLLINHKPIIYKGHPQKVKQKQINPQPFLKKCYVTILLLNHSFKTRNYWYMLLKTDQVLMFNQCIIIFIILSFRKFLHIKKFLK